MFFGIFWFACFAMCGLKAVIEVHFSVLKKQCFFIITSNLQNVKITGFKIFFITLEIVNFYISFEILHEQHFSIHKILFIIHLYIDNYRFIKI